MRAFLDTSMLVATFYGDHEHHKSSMHTFLQFDKTQVCCSAHSLAEVYSVLTGMPAKHKVSGDQAMLFLGNVKERLTIISLDDEEYFKALEWSASMGIAGGGIYDAVLAFCARKAESKAIYTWSPKDFQRLGSEVARLVKTPQ